MANGWKDIEGYNGFYQINDKGYVKSFRKLGCNADGQKVRDGRLLKLRNDSKGYPIVVLSKGKTAKTYRVHRLVARHYIPNPENKPCVNHLDGNKTNNSVDNLEWCTFSENSKHAYDNGLTPEPPRVDNRGENQGRSKLKRNDVLQIRSIYKQGWFTQSEIATAYNVGQDQISRIINRKRWQHI